MRAGRRLPCRAGSGHGRRVALIACFAAALGFAVAAGSRAQSPFGTPVADSTFIDSLRTAYRDSLRFAAQDTMRADSLVAVFVHAMLKDSLQAAGADTTGVTEKTVARIVTITGADSTVIREALGLVGQQGPGFHPIYRIGVNDTRDYRVVTQALQQLAFDVGSRLKVTTDANSSNRTTKSFSQKFNQKSSTSTVTYGLTKDVNIISTLALNTSTNQPPRGQTRTQTNNSFQTGTSFSRAVGDSALLHVDLTGGSTGETNFAYASSGASGNMHGTLTATPVHGIHTTADYTGMLSRDNSKDNTTHVQTRDRTTDNKFSGTAQCTLPLRTSLGLNYSIDQGSTQRPDTTTGVAVVRQETQSSDNSSMGLTADVKPIDALTLHVEGSTGSRVSDLKLYPKYYVNVGTQASRAAVSYTLPVQTALSVSLSNQETRTQYRDLPGSLFKQAGRNLFRTLDTSAKQPFGPRLSVEAHGDLQLTSDIYDDKTANMQDRDGLDTRYSLKGDYKAKNFLQMTCEFSLQNSKSVYVDSTQSAQNTSSDTYSLRPAITFILAPGLTVVQTYELDATYTEYVYDDTKNTVARIATLNTAFNYNLTPRVELTFTHTYRDQDSGQQLRDPSGARAYSPQAKTERQQVDFALTYKAAEVINFKAEERVLRDRSFTYQDGVRRHTGTELNEYLTAGMNGTFHIRDHLALNYNGNLNLGDGRLVPANQEKYSTVTLDLTYTY